MTGGLQWFGGTKTMHLFLTRRFRNCAIRFILNQCAPSKALKRVSKTAIVLHPKGGAFIGREEETFLSFSFRHFEVESFVFFR